MADPRPIDAREVDRVEALVTADDSARADEFLSRCEFGSRWLARIRTAEVEATVLARNPLGSFDERQVTCLRLGLSRSVPVEPRLRFRLEADDDPGLTASALVRPWDTESA
ncbi:MAG: hypothetical protein U0800_09130 [Isosphaeraceae bacterium]